MRFHRHSIPKRALLGAQALIKARPRRPPRSTPLETRARSRSRRRHNLPLTPDLNLAITPEAKVAYAPRQRQATRRAAAQKRRSPSDRPADASEAVVTGKRTIGKEVNRRRGGAVSHPSGTVNADTADEAGRWPRCRTSASIRRWPAGRCHHGQGITPKPSSTMPRPSGRTQKQLRPRPLVSCSTFWHGRRRGASPAGQDGGPPVCKCCGRRSRCSGKNRDAPARAWA